MIGASVMGAVLGVEQPPSPGAYHVQRDTQRTKSDSRGGAITPPRLDFIVLHGGYTHPTDWAHGYYTSGMEAVNYCCFCSKTADESGWLKTAAELVRYRTVLVDSTIKGFGTTNRGQRMRWARG